MLNDTNIQHLVMDTLAAEPAVDATHVGVAVERVNGNIKMKRRKKM